MRSEPVCSKKEYISYMLLNRDILFSLLGQILIMLPVIFILTCMLAPSIIHITEPWQVFIITIFATIIFELLMIGVVIKGREKTYDLNLLSNKQIEITDDGYKECTMDGEKQIPWEEFFDIRVKKNLYILVLEGKTPIIWDQSKLTKDEIEALKAAVTINTAKKNRGKDLIRQVLEQQISEEDEIYEMSSGFKERVSLFYVMSYKILLSPLLISVPTTILIFAIVTRVWGIAFIAGLFVFQQLMILLIYSYANNGFKKDIVFVVLNQEGISTSNLNGKKKTNWEEIVGVIETRRLFYVIKKKLVVIPIQKRMIKADMYALLKANIKTKSYIKQHLEI